MFYSFRGGIHPYGGKKLTSGCPVQELPPPAEVVIPMSMHVGAPCAPTVAAGDKVCLGDIIGSSQAPVSAQIYSSVSGAVKCVEPRPHPNGSDVMAVVIENDGLDTPSPSLCSHLDEFEKDPASLVEIMHNAGIVGAGGAAFPSHFKLKGAIGKADTLIINASECEPYITADNRLLLENGEQVLEGGRMLMRAMGLDHFYIVTEANKKDAAEHLRKLIGDDKSVILKVFRTRYPQGAEKQLIYSVTGREVPPGGLPADVKCAVFNSYTAFGVSRAVRTGIPAIDRIITVSGPGIQNPKNFRARVGTPIRALIDAAGGLKSGYDKVLLGGPMMGNAIFNLDVPVLKATNAVTVPESVPAPEYPSCIRCGRCVAVCPMRLYPLYLYMYERSSDLAALDKYNVRDCIECGCCAWECPGRLPLVQSVRTAKAKLAAKNGR